MLLPNYLTNVSKFLYFLWKANLVDCYIFFVKYFLRAIANSDTWLRKPNFLLW